MKCISIRQPWAWMILHAGKDVENRTWTHPYRGPLLIHASSTMLKREYEQACWWAANVAKCEVAIPAMNELETGGIIGMVDMTGITFDRSASRWFDGPCGLKFANARALPFVPMRARLSIFEVETNIVNKLKLK